MGPVYFYDMTCFKYEIYIYCYVSIICNKHGYGLLSRKLRQILSRINFETKCLLSVDETGAEGLSESDVYELFIRDVNVQDEGTFTCSVSGTHVINQDYILTVNSKCITRLPD